MIYIEPYIYCRFYSFKIVAQSKKDNIQNKKKVDLNFFPLFFSSFLFQKKKLYKYNTISLMERQFQVPNKRTNEWMNEITSRWKVSAEKIFFSFILVNQNMAEYNHYYDYDYYHNRILYSLYFHYLTLHYYSITNSIFFKNSFW